MREHESFLEVRLISDHFPYWGKVRTIIRRIFFTLCANRRLSLPRILYYPLRKLVIIKHFSLTARNILTNSFFLLALMCSHEVHGQYISIFPEVIDQEEVKEINLSPIEFVETIKIINPVEVSHRGFAIPKDSTHEKYDSNNLVEIGMGNHSDKTANNPANDFYDKILLPDANLDQISDLNFIHAQILCPWFPITCENTAKSSYEFSDFHLNSYVSLSNPFANEPESSDRSSIPDSAWMEFGHTYAKKNLISSENPVNPMQNKESLFEKNSNENSITFSQHMRMNDDLTTIASSTSSNVLKSVFNWTIHEFTDHQFDFGPDVFNVRQIDFTNDVRPLIIFERNYSGDPHLLSLMKQSSNETNWFSSYESSTNFQFSTTSLNQTLSFKLSLNKDSNVISN